MGKAILGLEAKERNAIENCEGYQLREAGVRYKAVLKAEKDDIGPKNTSF